MTSFAKRLSRRTFILSLLSLAAFKRFYSDPEKTVLNDEDDSIVLSGNWLLKKSDLS